MKPDSKNKEYVFVIGITLIALVLRVIGMPLHFGLWLDELLGYHIANLSNIAEIVKYSFFTDLHAPVFFVVLHFWIKLFGNADWSLWMLPVLLSTACVPAGYVVAKKLFGTKTASIFGIFIAFSGFQIYYAQELKFYSMISLLSIVSVYFFIKIFEAPKKLDYIGLFASNLLIIYTFNLGILFVVCEFLVGAVYSVWQKKESLKGFLAVFALSFLAYAPYFIVQLLTIRRVSGGICSLTDMFSFDFSTILLFIQNFFSPYFVHANGNPMSFSLFKGVSPILVTVTIFSIILYVFGLFSALRRENKSICLVFSTGVLFLLFEIILGFSGKVPVVTRYTILAHPILLIVAAFGLSFLNGKVAKILISAFALICVFTFIFSDTAVIKKGASHYPLVAHYLKANSISKNDYVLMPYYGHVLYKYFDEAKTIDLRAASVMLDEKYAQKETVLGTGVPIDKTNAKKVLRPYFSSKTPPKSLENYLSKNYFDKMKKGEKLALVINYLDYIIPKPAYWYGIENHYSAMPMYPMLYSSIIYNLESLCNSRLKRIKTENLQNLDLLIIIYEKS